MKKGTYLTHVVPLRPHEWTLFDIVMAVKGSWKIKTKNFQRVDSKDKGFKY